MLLTRFENNIKFIFTKKKKNKQEEQVNEIENQELREEIKDKEQSKVLFFFLSFHLLLSFYFYIFFSCYVFGERLIILLKIILKVQALWSICYFGDYSVIHYYHSKFDR